MSCGMNKEMSPPRIAHARVRVPTGGKSSVSDLSAWAAEPCCAACTAGERQACAASRCRAGKPAKPRLPGSGLFDCRQQCVRKLLTYPIVAANHINGTEQS